MRISSPLRTLVFTACLLGLPAQASDQSAELVDAWKLQAERLYGQLSDLQGEGLPDQMQLEISRFGRVASRLAEAGEATENFPTDLKCIFRGMAEEADMQLDVMAHADSAASAQDARKRLLLMLEDAQIVAVSARPTLSGPALSVAPEDRPPAQCSTLDDRDSPEHSGQD